MEGQQELYPENPFFGKETESFECCINHLHQFTLCLVKKVFMHSLCLCVKILGL